MAETMTTHVYSPGKVDYNGSGVKNNRVEIEWSLQNGRFSMSGSVWDARHFDILAGGQMIDEIAGLFPADEKVQRMAAIWERWHLNDMRAGSPAQMEYLRQHPISEDDYRYPKSHYEVASERLAGAGLNPDTSEGGYRYGSAWLTEELPEEVIAEIESWG